MRKFQVTVNGKSYEVEVEELGASHTSTVQTAEAPVVASAPMPATSAAPKAPEVPPVATGDVGSVKVEAPMQGKIISVAVSVGAAVKEGDVLAVLEAMKMENEIVAPSDGTVASVNVNSGQSVESGDLIISLK